MAGKKKPKKIDYTSCIAVPKRVAKCQYCGDGLIFSVVQFEVGECGLFRPSIVEITCAQEKKHYEKGKRGGPVHNLPFYLLHRRNKAVEEWAKINFVQKSQKL